RQQRRGEGGIFIADAVARLARLRELLEGELIFDQQLDEERASAGQLGQRLAQRRLMRRQIFLADAVVDDHLSHRRRQCAGKGGDTSAAGRRFFRRKLTEKVLQRL